MKKYLGLSGLQDVIKKIRDLITSVENNLNSHTLNKSNPHKVTKEQIGLSNVENKSSATIRSELTKENIVDGLGYTPPTKDTIYTHPTYTAKTNGLYKVTVDSTGHVSAVASVTKADITALGIPGQDTNTTYGVATQSTNGLLSSTDKTKLDGIATGANKYVLPTASSSTLGGVKTTSQVTSSSGYTACPIISGVPYYKDTNTTYSLGSFGITATAVELNYTDGVTSNIQTQLNGKAASSHSHTKSQISDFPSSMPASDVYSWAKAVTKPSYSWGEITGKPTTFTPTAHSHHVAQSYEPSGQNNGDLWFKTI